MGKLKEYLIKQQEDSMEQDEIDAMWHQKQLEFHDQQQCYRLLNQQRIQCQGKG